VRRGNGYVSVGHITTLGAYCSSRANKLAVTPVIIRLLERVVAFPIHPIRHSDNSERKIYPPNHVHNIGGDSIDSKKMYRNPIPDLGDKYRYEGRYDHTETSVFKQSNTTPPNKLSEILHRILLFYKSYYGQSTKAEKNPFR